MGASASTAQLGSHPGPYGAHASYKYEYRTVTPSSTAEQLLQLTREKKKKITSFATLRKKLTRKKRSSRSFDHAKALRELVSDWSVKELHALVEEYEACSSLKDLMIQADLARPPASTYKRDLSELYDYKHCSDVDLIFQNTCFPVHRAILSARCPYFREVLSKCPGFGAQITIDIRSLNIEIPTFSALLRYLYTGDFGTHEFRLENLDLLIQLGDEFGSPNALDHDLRYLFETGDYADCVLVFTSEGESHTSGGQCSSEGSQSDYGFHHRLELPCHKAILSARSPFFRNIIQRRQRSGEEMTERALHTPTKIILDESVIPRRYARVLLHAIYLDGVDLSLIVRDSSSQSSLSEVQAIVQTGRTHLTLVEEAMEIYQIGRFLELDILSQGCEDIMVESLSLDNLAQVLRWSSQPHGSPWVRRQAMHFLREEFQAIAQSPVLFEMDKTHLVEVLQSDFLQASELEVLQTVLKWGEHELIRRMEDREPNLLSTTAHSVSKKGIKKRDLNDVELREILSPLLPLVRMDHVIPLHCEALTSAIKRGLVPRPPSHMIGDDVNMTYRINAWIRSKNNGLYVKPRLFTPYYEESKALLEEQLHTTHYEVVGGGRMRRLHAHMHSALIPDTLYMVEEPPTSHLPYANPLAGLDVIAGAAPGIPEPEVMQSMLKREAELRGSPAVQRAYSLPLSSRRQVNTVIRLRVVREFNLPDSILEALENAEYYSTEEVDDRAEMQPYGMQETSSYHPAAHHQPYHSEPTPPRPYRHVEVLNSTPDASSLSEGHLSDMMPDIALATATASLGSLHLTGGGPEEQEMELDLGDGASHYHHHHHHLQHHHHPPPPPPVMRSSHHHRPHRHHRSSPMFL